MQSFFVPHVTRIWNNLEFYLRLTLEYVVSAKFSNIWQKICLLILWRLIILGLILWIHDKQGKPQNQKAYSDLF